MQHFIKLFSALSFILFFAACANTPAVTVAPTPDVSAVQTQAAATTIAQITASAPQPTATSEPSATPQATNTPSATNTRKPVPTDSAPKLKILDTANFTDSLGTTHVIGVVANDSVQPASFVKVVVSFYDANDNIVSTAFAYTLLEVIGGKDTAPFDVVALDNVSSAKTYRTQVEGQVGGKLSKDLEILSHKSIRDSLGTQHIKGEVKNNGSTPASFVKLVATLYDLNRKTAGVTFGYTTLQTIPPGATSPFDIIFVNELKGGERYEIAVEGQ